MNLKKIVLAALLVIIIASLSYYGLLQHREQRYDHIIERASKRHGVPFELIKAVIRKESKFIADQRGRDDEYGLMQIRPIAADEWARKAKRPKLKNYALLQEPEININVGTFLLAQGLHRWRRYTHVEALTLAEYNAGARRMREHKWVPPTYDGEVMERINFPLTKKYVGDILKFKKIYADKITNE